MKYSLSVIKDVKTLEDLIKYDDIIRRYSRRICNKHINISDDIVNDMYIRVWKILPKKVEIGLSIDGGYINGILYNLYKTYYNSLKKRGHMGVVLYDILDDSDDILSEKVKHDLLYDELEERISNLHWYERKVLEINKYMSLLELSKQSGISYRSLLTTRDKINKKLGVIKKNK